MTPSRDDLWIQRYVDGELSADDAADFSARLLREPELRARADAQQQLRSGFVGEEAAAPPAGFTANVLAEVRRLPDRAELESMDVSAAAVRVCVRVLLAAGLLLGLGLAWNAGLLDGGRSDQLQAAPATIEKELERLDQLILESMEAPPRGR